MWYIKHLDSCTFLSRITVGRSPFVYPVEWTVHEDYAIHFSSYEEAEATAQFLVNVISFELEDRIEICRIFSSGAPELQAGKLRTP